jgi:Fe2+-dicitrate sensor, membrane component
MPRKSSQHKTGNQHQDDLWNKAWQSPGSMDAAKKQTLLHNIHQRIDTRPRRKKLFFISMAAAAAILVAVLINIPGHLVKEPANAWYELASTDSLKKVLLTDGSALWLAPHSAISVYADFGNKRQLVLTKGTVFFQVAKDAHHPFSIMVNNQQVTVLGTAFTIHKLDSVDIQLSVKEGKVALDNLGGRHLLTAGQQVHTEQSMAGAIDTIQPAAADWWLQEKVRMYNISLGELLNRVATYYRVPLSANGIDSNKKVTLTWDLRMALEENLAVLNTLTGYDIH